MALAVACNLLDDPLMRPRTSVVRPIPSERRIVVAALRAGRRQFPVHGLTSVDVTDVVAALKEADPPGSLTAHVVAAVARAVARHPEVGAYRDWRGRLVVPQFVDVATLVEVERQGGSFPLAHVLGDADARSVDDLTRELHAVKARPASSGSGRLLGWARLARVPFVVSAMYAIAARSRKLRSRSGTVAVTSVGMFTGGAGHAIGHPTIMTLSVVVGGMSDRPVVRHGEVVVRRLLDLTVSVDHRIVDGAPLARFGADLRRLVESPSLAAPPDAATPPT